MPYIGISKKTDFKYFTGDGQHSALVNSHRCRVDMLAFPPADPGSNPGDVGIFPLSTLNIGVHSHLVRKTE